MKIEVHSEEGKLLGWMDAPSLTFATVSVDMDLAPPEKIETPDYESDDEDAWIEIEVFPDALFRREKRSPARDDYKLVWLSGDLEAISSFEPAKQRV